MTTELRRDFHDRLAHLHWRVEGMGRIVAEGIRDATTALLEHDHDLATRVVAADADVDAIYPWVEAEIFDVVARQAPVARDLRLVIASSRVAANLERCGDLVASIARRTGRIDPSVLDAEPRNFIARMGTSVGSVFDLALSAYATLDADLAASVGPLDDEIDDLQRQLLRYVVGGSVEPEAAVEVALVARFYERVGDHAVVIAERVRFVALGEMDAGDRDEQR